MNQNGTRNTFLPSYKRQHNTKWKIEKKSSSSSSITSNHSNKSVNKSFHRSGSTNDDIDIPATKWVQLHCEGEAPSPRKGTSCNFWKARGLYVFFGGANEGTGVAFTPYNDVFTFDVDKERWIKRQTYGEKDDIPYPRYLHLSVILKNTLYIIAGKGKIRSSRSKFSKNESFYDAYELNLNTWTWSRIANNINTGLSMILKHPLYKCFPLHWNDNEGGIIIFGGSEGNSKSYGTSSNKNSRTSSRSGLLDHFLLNLETGTYLTPVASGNVPSTRYNYSIVQHNSNMHRMPNNLQTSSNYMHDDESYNVNNCCFILFGGINGKQKFADTYAFFPNHGAGGNWEKLETINPPTARYGHSAVIVNNVMVVIGGFNEGWRNDVHCLDLTSFIWYEPYELPRHTLPPREAHVSFLIRKNLSVFGGSCWPICRNDMQCLHNTTDIVNSCTKKGRLSTINFDDEDNNNNSSDRVERKESANTYYRKQKLSGINRSSGMKGTLKARRSSNDSSDSGYMGEKKNGLNAGYVFTNDAKVNGNDGLRSRSSSNTSSVDMNEQHPLIRLAAPSQHLKKDRPESPRASILSPSYSKVKKTLSAGNSIVSKSLNSSLRDHDSHYNTSRGISRQRTSSPYTVKFDPSTIKQASSSSRSTFPSILGKNRNNNNTTDSSNGVFLTQLDQRSPSKSPIKRLHNSFDMQGKGSPINFDKDNSYESQIRSVEENNKQAETLQENIETIQVPLMKLKKVVQAGEVNAQKEKEKYDMEVINESKAINLLRKEEQKAQLKVEEMLNALGEATKMYKDNEKRVLQQQRMKEESMKLQHEAADTINRLKADLNQLFMSGDKFHEEEKQLTHDIANLKTLLKKQREEKDNMKKKLETVQNERKLAEAKVLDQQNTLTVLRKHYEMLQSDLNGRF